MPKTAEPKKKEAARKQANVPYNNPIKQYERSLHDFIKSHKEKYNVITKNVNILNDEITKLQTEKLEQQDVAKELQEKLNMKIEEITNITETKNLISAENQTFKTTIMTNEEKYIKLEVDYDKNLTALRLENANLKQELQQQTQNISKSVEEFAKNRKELQEELLEKSKTLTELNTKTLKLEQGLASYKETVEKSSKEKVSSLELELENIRSTLKIKDEALIKITNEKNELEQAKNKIIDEQTYKIREIERIFDQPTRAIQPNINRQPQSAKEVLPFPVSAENVPTVAAPSILSTNTDLVNDVSRADTRRSVRGRRQDSRQASFSYGSSVSNQTVKSVKSMKSTKQRNEQRFTSAAPNEFSLGSESDSDISHCNVINQFLNTFRVPSTPIQGFGNLKRRSSDDVEIPETSESEKNFHQLKRGRNE